MTDEMVRVERETSALRTRKQPDNGDPAALAALDFAPKSLRDIRDMATMISESRLGPEVWRNPNAGVVLLITAMEMGLTIGQAFRGMYAVNGMPAFTSGLAMAIVRSHSECEYLRFVESTDQRATCRTKRRSNPEPCTFTYTIEDARRAGFLQKEVWQRNPADMLRAKAALRVCRMEYQDLLFGFAAKEEEEEGLTQLEPAKMAVETMVAGVQSTPTVQATVVSREPEPSKSRRGKRTEPAQPTPAARAPEPAQPPPPSPSPPATPLSESELESIPWAKKMLAATSVPELDEAAACASLDFNAPEDQMDNVYNRMLAKLVGSP